MNAGSKKAMPLSSVERRLQDSPAMREGLVLANGIFDLIHVGHVRYLTGAKQSGTTLLVAVNSDASARRLKGPGRPLTPLEERIEVVAALECVDWVTWFEEDSVEHVLRRLRPAIHAKGTDYTVESVPERGIAQALDVRTVIVGDPKHHATSDLIRRIGLLVAGSEGTRSG
ncbi:MAG: D-glycero-beta-D-manno-heptose 1-phosphate adenylyltransferase [Candidatus Eisenbacteria bacterium]|uniref:D-glycero-beta-D-manno-heptose 1-phosphate adenylyltransferase n=1 Tax=Eiseniibacteriota bacterium TaxID=2212470 RepID=A0A538SW91_UNCEI|nr:MAG: D-glycero-beta-D-manno-heptose 1-phosphate adenylyltransferase [Candidatus Eisenbacteria bacterium]TMQ61542.1 MAG: D-glycero-beta-D-manno-heptose 1-phosphate adenylyltransferase [Candidatus Eisenbacteria bacterium]